MTRRRLVPFLLLAIAAGCRSAPRGVDLPPSYERNGIQVTVTEILRTTTKDKGVAGTAWNHTGREISCQLEFRALNAYGEDIAKARAERSSWKPGESWKFRATYDRSNVLDVKTILPGKVKVGGAY